MEVLGGVLERFKVGYLQEKPLNGDMFMQIQTCENGKNDLNVGGLRVRPQKVICA